MVHNCVCVLKYLIDTRLSGAGQYGRVDSSVHSKPGCCVSATAGTRGSSSSLKGRPTTTSPTLPAVDVIVSTTWTVPGLVTPVACQYQLVRMMPRIALFTISASHIGAVRVGASFQVQALTVRMHPKASF